MARIRTIKPEFWSHPVMSKEPAEVRLLAIALLNLADDEGYFLATPALVRSFAFPLDEDSTNARRGLARLSDVGWIVVREHPSHGPVGVVVNFAKHQRIDRPSPSRIKVYHVDESSTNPRRILDDQSTLDQGAREQGNKGTGNGKAETPRSARFVPPSLDEVAEYCAERGQGVDPERWMNFYESNGWKVGKNSMKDWRAAVRTWEKNGFQTNKPEVCPHAEGTAAYWNWYADRTTL